MTPEFASRASRPRCRQSASGSYVAGAASAAPAIVRTFSKPLWKREYSERAAELGVIAELLVTPYGTEAVGTVLRIEPRGHADACPAADPRKHAHVLLALVLIRVDIADDARRVLELE